MRCARVLEKGIIIAILAFYTNTKHLKNNRIIANLSLYANTQHRMKKERKLIEGEKPRMADRHILISPQRIYQISTEQTTWFAN